MQYWRNDYLFRRVGIHSSATPARTYRERHPIIASRGLWFRLRPGSRKRLISIITPENVQKLVIRCKHWRLKATDHGYSWVSYSV